MPYTYQFGIVELASRVYVETSSRISTCLYTYGSSHSPPSVCVRWEATIFFTLAFCRSPLLKPSFKRLDTLEILGKLQLPVVDVMHAWLAMRPFHYAFLAFELLLDLSRRWALGLVVCVFTFQFAWMGDCSAAHFPVFGQLASFFTFVRSSASNPMDIYPSACFCFW